MACQEAHLDDDLHSEDTSEEVIKLVQNLKKITHTHIKGYL